MTSQAQRIFSHLEEKGSITNAQAHNIYGIRHLPSVIRDIKKRYGTKIYDWWTTGKNRFGENCRWKVYSLNEQTKTA